MTVNCQRLLAELAECQRGKGMVISARAEGYSYCLSRGWITRMRAAGITVTSITDEGRKALAQQLEG